MRPWYTIIFSVHYQDTNGPAHVHRLRYREAHQTYLTQGIAGQIDDITFANILAHPMVWCPVDKAGI